MSATTDQIVPKRVGRRVYWVTGTDTDVGKTTISAALLARARAQDWRCYGVKPISAGCTQVDGEWQSPDAMLLNQYASVSVHPDLVAPIRLPLAIAPHLAAQETGMALSVSRIVGMVRGALTTPATHVLIEGAGGWRVPLNAREYLSDIAKTLQHPVILVVAMRLGCLNHALLTAQAIRQDGLTLAGWIANCVVENEPFLQAQIDTLKQHLDAPCLGVVPYQKHPDIAQIAQDVMWPDEYGAAQKA